jgi:hypothetical protein
VTLAGGAVTLHHDILVRIWCQIICCAGVASSVEVVLQQLQAQCKGQALGPGRCCSNCGLREWDRVNHWGWAQSEGTARARARAQATQPGCTLTVRKGEGGKGNRPGDVLLVMPEGVLIMDIFIIHKVANTYNGVGWCVHCSA